MLCAMVHRARGVAAAAASLILGTGLGIALAGRLKRAFAWLGAMILAALVVLVTPWSALLLLVVHVSAAVDAYRIASRSEQPLRLGELGPVLLFVSAIMSLILLRSYVVEAFKIPSSSQCPTLIVGDHIYVNKLVSLWRAPRRGELAVFVYPCEPERDYISRVVALPGETVEVRCDLIYINGTVVPQTLVAAKTTYVDHDESMDRWYDREVSRYHEVLGDHSHDLFSHADRPEQGEPHPVRDFPIRGNGPPSCANEFERSAPTDQVLGKIVETKPESAATCEPQIHYVVPADHLFVMGDNRENSNDSRIWGAVPIANVKGIVSSIWLSQDQHLHLGRIGRVE